MKLLEKNLIYSGGGILSLLTLSLLCLGSASWAIGNSASLSANVNVGDVAKLNFSNSAYYIAGSEKGFDFYTYSNRHYYTKTTFSIRGKCRPDLLKTMFASKEVAITFGITYDYYTLENYNIFEENNQILIVPQNFKCELETSENRFLFSTDLDYRESSYVNETTYVLQGNILAYSESKPCLYSLTKDYQTGTAYVYFQISFEFINLNLDNDAIFPQLSFHFLTNLGGITH